MTEGTVQAVPDYHLRFISDEKLERVVIYGKHPLAKEPSIRGSAEFQNRTTAAGIKGIAKFGNWKRDSKRDFVCSLEPRVSTDFYQLVKQGHPDLQGPAVAAILQRVVRTLLQVRRQFDGRTHGLLRPQSILLRLASGQTLADAEVFLTDFQPDGEAKNSEIRDLLGVGRIIVGLARGRPDVQGFERKDLNEIGDELAPVHFGAQWQAWRKLAYELLTLGDHEGIRTLEQLDARLAQLGGKAPLLRAKRPQTITFDPLPEEVFANEWFAVSAQASSGLPVQLQVLSGPAKFDGGFLKPHAPGRVVLTAHQDGNDAFEAVPETTVSFEVKRKELVQRTFQFVTFSQAIGIKRLGDPPFRIEATASSGLPLRFEIVSGPAKVQYDIITLTGVGSVVIRASQAGTEAYAPASKDQEFAVARGPQTITFNPLPEAVFAGDGFGVSAHASSGLPVQLLVSAGPAKLEGGLLNTLGPGLVVITARQAGNDEYEAAPETSASLEVKVKEQTAQRAVQLISFSPIGAKTFGDAPFRLSARTNSGMIVCFEVLAGPARVLGDVVTLTGAGQVVILAFQPGNDDFLPDETRQEFSVARGKQTLLFDPLPDNSFFGDALPLSAVASSGLPVDFIVASGPAAIEGVSLRLRGNGPVVVRATQPGNANYEPAPEVTRTVRVRPRESIPVKSPQAITFAPLPNKTLGGAPFALAATSSSGLPVRFQILSGPATLHGNELILTGVGKIEIEASQPGDARWEPATAVVRSFAVAKVSQAIAFSALSDKVFGEAPITLEAQATSGLPVNFRVVSGQADITGNRVTLRGAGKIEIEASQPGDARWEAAAAVVRSFAVAKASQTINFGPLSAKVFGESPFSLSARTSSGLEVTFGIVSGPARVSGDRVTLLGAGVVRIQASQPGNANFHAAPEILQALTVAKAPQKISLEGVPKTAHYGDSLRISACSSAGLPVHLRVASGPAEIREGRLIFNDVGSVELRAAQPGNDDYLAAPPIEVVIGVRKAPQTITLDVPSGRRFVNDSVGLTAAASSGLPVEFVLRSGPAQLEDATLRLTGAGEVRVAALQAGDQFHEAAEQEFAITVVRRPQKIRFDELPDRKLGEPPFKLEATADSRLRVQFAVVSGPASLSGSELTLTGRDTVEVKAGQPGNVAYDPAPEVTQSFTVTDPKRQRLIVFACVMAGLLLGAVGFGGFWWMKVQRDERALKGALAAVAANNLSQAFTELERIQPATSQSDALKKALSTPPRVGDIQPVIVAQGSSNTLTIGPLEKNPSWDQLKQIRWKVGLAPASNGGLTLSPSVAEFAAGETCQITMKAAASAMPNQQHTFTLGLTNAVGTNVTATFIVTVTPSPCTLARQAAEVAEAVPDPDWAVVAGKWQTAREKCDPEAPAEVANGLAFAQAMYAATINLNTASSQQDSNPEVALRACTNALTELDKALLSASAADPRDLKDKRSAAVGSLKSRVGPVQTAATRALGLLKICKQAVQEAQRAEGSGNPVWADVVSKWQEAQSKCPDSYGSETTSGLAYAQAMNTAQTSLAAAKQAAEPSSALVFCTNALEKLAVAQARADQSDPTAKQRRTDAVAALRDKVFAERKTAEKRQEDWAACETAKKAAQRAEQEATDNWQPVLTAWQQVANICGATTQSLAAIQFASAMTNVAALFGKAGSLKASKDTNELSQAMTLCDQVQSALTTVRAFATNSARSGAHTNCSDQAQQVRSTALGHLKDRLCDVAKQRATGAEATNNWSEALKWWMEARQTCLASDLEVTNGIAFAQGMTNILALLNQARPLTNSAPTQATQLCSQITGVLATIKPPARASVRWDAWTQFSDEVAAVRAVADGRIAYLQNAAAFCADLKSLMKPEAWTLLDSKLKAEESQAFTGERCFTDAQDWAKKFLGDRVELFKVWCGISKNDVPDQGIEGFVSGPSRPGSLAKKLDAREMNLRGGKKFISAWSQLKLRLESFGVTAPNPQEIEQKLKNILDEEYRPSNRE